jgi:hypothetical protein
VALNFRTLAQPGRGLAVFTYLYPGFTRFHRPGGLWLAVLYLLALNYRNSGINTHLAFSGKPHPELSNFKPYLVPYNTAELYKCRSRLLH